MRTIAPRQPLPDAVQEAIQEYIVGNELKPGDPLPSESELAQRIGVSRNSVREGVRSLMGLGILEARQGSGLFVREFSFDPILNVLPYGMHFHVKQHSDLLEVRYYLEWGMADRVIHAVTANQIQGLQATLERFGNEARRGRYSAVDDRAFHNQLYENIDNAVLQKILDLFWELLSLALERSELVASPIPMATHSRHLPILEAVRRQDAAAFRTAITAHYVGIEKRLPTGGESHPTRIPTMAETSRQAVLRPASLVIGADGTRRTNKKANTFTRSASAGVAREKRN